MLLQLLHRGVKVAQYVSNAHHVHGVRGRCAHNIYTRLAGGCVGLQLTAFSFGGTAFSRGSGAHHISARPVSAPPTTWHLAGIALARCTQNAPAAHSPLACARLIAAQHCHLDRQHNRHRQRGRHHLLHRRQLFFQRLRALLAADAVAAGRCEAAWTVRRRPRRRRRRGSTAPMLARLGRAVRASPASPAALRSSSAASRVPPRDIRRKLQASTLFYFNCDGACGALVHSWKELAAGFPTV